MNWLEDYRAAIAAELPEPFLQCLAEAIARVESGHGRHRIETAQGLNEIGYKALPGHPRIMLSTQEADNGTTIRPVRRAFRLFRDRREQAQALAWLMRSSIFYEAARLLYVLTFYAAYAPGRNAGARALVEVFNQLARSGRYDGVRPLGLAERGGGPAPDHNHAAARRAVRLFAELTRTDPTADSKED